ncbi:Thioredoxin domain containing protein [Perkinsela sp. CCAP 1560/4]|nr:Thioredoxin domain containing protein [Perkinsela sp. CCAP 1560/4]|eukprot:KNH09709.1 Thioredoxin domain containing protein [Perkinsela sp. CCAP 1560/4]
MYRLVKSWPPLYTAPFLVYATNSRAIVYAFRSCTGDLMKMSNDFAIVVKFTAKWCGPCQNIAPLFAFMSDYYPMVWFYHVDVDDHPALASDFDIQAVPTFFVLHRGKIEKRIDGPSIVSVKDALDTIVGPPVGT